jgi:hypothetical protein
MASGIVETRADDATTGEACAGISAPLQRLATILNTRDKSFDCLSLNLDEKANIVGVRFEIHDVDDAGTQSARSVRIREFTAAQLAADRGAVLDGRPGHDALLLRMDIGAGKADIPLVVTYLYNGVTGEYRTCNGSLSRALDGNWHLVNGQGHDVSVLVVKTWGVPVVGTIGIESVQGICT